MEIYFESGVYTRGNFKKESRRRKINTTGKKEEKKSFSRRTRSFESFFLSFSFLFVWKDKTEINRYRSEFAKRNEKVDRVRFFLVEEKKSPRCEKIRSGRNKVIIIEYLVGGSLKS